MYDATIKTIRFDEIRVRYRQQRRSVIRDIILKNLSGKPLNKYISSQATKLVKKKTEILSSKIL